MDVRDLYTTIGVDFDDVLALLRKEDRVKTYLVQTMEEPAFAELDRAMASREYDSAFRAAHTIKGMGMNLMLEPMTAAAVDLVECLRNGVAPEDEDTAAMLYTRLKEQCDLLASLVRELS